LDAASKWMRSDVHAEPERPLAVFGVAGRAGDERLRTPVYAYRAPPPPPPMLGVEGYAPGRAYVWIDGFYDLRGSTWVWSRGKWDRPPHPRAVWVRAYWEPHGRSYRFHRGYWRH